MDIADNETKKDRKKVKKKERNSLKLNSPVKGKC